MTDDKPIAEMVPKWDEVGPELLAALRGIARLTENRMVVEDGGLLAMRITPTAGAIIARAAIAKATTP